MRYRQSLGKLCVLPLALVLSGSTTPLGSAAPQQQKPWTKDQIIRMLKGDMPPKRIGELARERGIDFPVTPDTENELRQAGATAELLTLLQQLAPKPAAPPKPAQIVVETQPDAQVYLDDVYKGQASPQGRLEIENPPAGQHV